MNKNLTHNCAGFKRYLVFDSLLTIPGLICSAEALFLSKA